MSCTTCSTGRQFTLPSSISRERRSMTSCHCVSASASTVSSRLAMSWRARNARSFSGRASTSATFSAAMLMRPKYRRLEVFLQECTITSSRSWSLSILRFDSGGSERQYKVQTCRFMLVIKGIFVSFLAALLLEANLSAQNLDLPPGAHISLIGNGLAEGFQRDGWLETLFQAQ